MWTDEVFSTCCRFFSYLSRLSCYRHIMLFGCSLALPECIAADDEHSRYDEGPVNRKPH